MINWLKRLWYNNFHVWEITSAKFGENKEYVTLGQTCALCKRVYITAEGVEFFLKFPAGVKFLSEAVYSIYIPK